jgi:hypothetical protein
MLYLEKLTCRRFTRGVFREPLDFRFSHTSSWNFTSTGSRRVSFEHSCGPMSIASSLKTTLPTGFYGFELSAEACRVAVEFGGRLFHSSTEITCLSGPDQAGDDLAV